VFRTAGRDFHRGAEQRSPVRRRIDLGKPITKPKIYPCKKEGDHRFFEMPLGYFPPPAYFNPPVTIGQAPPMRFTEQDSDGTTLNFWYYCANPAGYYPNVLQCPFGWQIVQANTSY
ncbi:MAG: hypothetical protein ABWY05_07790, partial [Noviherbaspirillum sp.]